MGEGSFSTSKLNGLNYGTWVSDVKVLLMERGCWKIVQGVEIPPDEAVESPKEIRNYKQRFDKAFTTIYLNLEDRFRSLIEDLDDGRKAWLTLEKHFRPESRARLMTLLDEFFACRIQPDETVGLFAARLRRIVSQLKGAGHPLEELYQSFQLIRHLPPAFEGIIQVIYRWKEENFTFDRVLEELLAEEARLKQRQGDQEAVAFIARSKPAPIRPTPTRFQTPVGSKPISRPKPARPSTPIANKVICYRCNQPGHYKNRCPEKTKHFKEMPGSSYVAETHCGEKCLDDTAWVFDTAASFHFCRNRELFRDFTPTKGEQMTVAVDGVTCPVVGRGTVTLNFGKEVIHLKNVIYSPNLRRNLLAGPRFDEGGAKFVGKGGKITVYHSSGRVHFSAKKMNGLYVCHPTYPGSSKEVTASLSQPEEAKMWHRRFAHINPQHLVQTSQQNCVKGLPKLARNFPQCEPCQEAKSKRVSFKPIGTIRSKKPLELVHMDLCGPLPKPSREGHRYFFTIIDDYSRKVAAYPLKEKSEAFDVFQRFQRRAERFLNERIVAVRTDNGLEFANEKFSSLFEEQGMRHERTNVYTPEQNGTAERFNYTAVDGIKVLLKDSGLSDGFWSEALLHFVYTWNRVCHTGQKITPFELYGGRQPSVKHLKPFGTKAFVGVPKQLRRKLDMRAKKGVLVGYALNTRGYRIWLPQERKIIETINVRFDETVKQEPEKRWVSSQQQGAVLDPFKNWYAEDAESDSEDEYTLPKEESVSTDESSEAVDDGEEEPGQSQEKLPPATEKPEPVEAVWIRKPVPRPDGSRTDIYYFLKGEKERLRSLNDISKYCSRKNLEYDPSIFNFSGTDNYEGIVKTHDNACNATSA